MRALNTTLCPAFQGSTPPRCPRGCRGFTFLELIVVVSLLAMITAAIVPLYGASINGLRSRSTKNELVSAIQYAQQQAVVEGREYRLLFDDKKRSFHVVQWEKMDEEEKVFAPVEEAWARKRELPGNLEFKKLPRQKDKQFKLPYIAFYPNGSCDRAEIAVEDKKDRAAGFSIELTGVIGKLKIEDNSAGNGRIHIV